MLFLAYGILVLVGLLLSSEEVDDSEGAQRLLERIRKRRGNKDNN